MRSLEYSELNLQTYFEHEGISFVQAKQIFRFRTKMSEEFRDNFRGADMYKLCEKCKDHTDSQEEIPNCGMFKKTKINLHDIQLAYGCNITKSTADLISRILEEKKTIQQ